MLSLARPLLMSILVSLANTVYATQGSTVSLHPTAYARQQGDLAAWQMCNLSPGIAVSFSHNPSRADSDRHGVVADRTRLDIHVTPAVKPGRYYLIFIAYSFVDGPRGGAIAFGYHPTLRVLSNHSISIPPFSRWFWIHAPNPQDIAPASTCSRLPSLESWTERNAGHTRTTSLRWI